MSVRGDFFGLTPDRVLAAVDAGGLATRPICWPLNSFENRVWEVELEDRSHVVAKFYRPHRWSKAAILEEHRFLAELAAAEVPVCAMRSFGDGTTLRRTGGIWYALADRRGGRAPDELSLPLARRFGALVGRLHQVAVAGRVRGRPPIAASTARAEIRWLDSSGLLPAVDGERWSIAAKALATEYEAVAEGVPTHRVHGDLHLGNVLERDGELRVLDFDDCAEGPAVQDLWLALPGRGTEAAAVQKAIVEGYQTFRELPIGSWRLVEPLRGVRMVRYASWLLRRRDDPAFVQGWPDLGSAEWWRETADDLEAQLAIVRGGDQPPADPGDRSRGAAEVPTELTNADYFWDWEG